jgi:protein-S-isoprenylcysteine O-methyltransferase Ste14
MPAARDGRAIHTLVSIGGGLLFAGSLAYFGWQYLRGFDAPPAPDARAAPAIVVDLLLFTLFALHHSLFARTGLKAAVTRTVPASLERSVYVWIASLLFIGVCACWQPVPGMAWHVTGWTADLLLALQAAGGVFTLVAARHLDVLELAGVRQALHLPLTRTSGLDDHGPYGLVRHPIYFAWLLLVWPTPLMNGTRLVFAAISTIYLLVAIPYEERDLRRQFGTAYDDYSRKVPRRLLPGIY